MKRLYFKSLRLLSITERAARKINFNKKLTIIKGSNDTGKSSLIKTIYRTLGAEPPNIHPKWESANVYSALTFELDNIEYTMLRTTGRYTLFDSNLNKLESFDKITSQMSPYYAKLFSFNLALERNGNVSQATPAFLFLPFYVDQDASWTKAWSGFQQLGQFCNWTKDIVQYHTGIKSEAYYLAKSRKSEKEKELTPFENRYNILNETLIKLEKRLEKTDFNINLDTYKNELERLLSRCDEIKIKEDELRATLSELNSKRYIIQSQINIAENTIKEVKKDYEFAMAETKEFICCPTCGAEYSNNFSEHFSIAQDEDRCQEMLVKLKIELADVDDKIKSVKDEKEKVSTLKNEIEKLLTEKKESISLKVLLESEGKKQACSIIHEDIASLNNEMAILAGIIRELSAIMRKSTNRERTGEIHNYYMNRMQKYLFELNVHALTPEQYTSMTGNIKESGSDLPRALLAYYTSIWETIAKYSESTFSPIIIDSPKQQDQDDENWNQILEFIKAHHGEDEQLIMGTVNTGNVQFDGQIIELKDKHQLLSKEAYKIEYEEMKPLLDKSIRD
jgi:predicted  nucleic acid-binding Zn-ribbon protein